MWGNTFIFLLPLPIFPLSSDHTEHMCTHAHTHTHVQIKIILLSQTFINTVAVFSPHGPDPLPPQRWMYCITYEPAPYIATAQCPSAVTKNLYLPALQISHPETLQQDHTQIGFFLGRSKGGSSPPWKWSCPPKVGLATTAGSQH